MINPDFFPDYNEARSIWTSTTLNHEPRYAFHLNLNTGETLYGMKIDVDYLHMHVRCVRGDAIASSLADLTVDATGVGQGSISSDPEGVGYTKSSSPSTQTGTFVAGREITVTATAKFGATVSWSGTCAAAGGAEGGTDTEATCHFAALDDSKTITADFPQTTPLPPVMTETDPHYYNTIAEAYGAVTFDVIRIQAVALTESLDLNKIALIVFKGGYDSLFHRIPDTAQ